MEEDDPWSGDRWCWSWERSRSARLQLRGNFSLDAISPDGSWIYLIQYTNPSNPTDYRVRALQAHTGRLLARPIVDPHDRGEAMRGRPLTRISSPDGRWAYTVYDGNGRPFLHALDTDTRTLTVLVSRGVQRRTTRGARERRV